MDLGGIVEKGLEKINVETLTKAGRSALDVLHEREFLDMLEREYQDKTIIMISHRASTLTNCRRIFELKDRMIREIRK